MPSPIVSSTPLILSRTFTSNAIRCSRSATSQLAHQHRDVPEYPYGPQYWYRQANFGLYGGRQIRFGNNVTGKFEMKTRRSWKPNVHSKRLWSVALQRWVRTRVITRVLRTIDKVGGLDEYLLGEKPSRIKELGMAGWLLRWRIMQTEMVKERFRREREGLGLLRDEKNVGVDGQRVDKEVLREQIREFDRRLDEQDRMGTEREKQEAEAISEEGTDGEKMVDSSSKAVVAD